MSLAVDLREQTPFKQKSGRKCKKNGIVTVPSMLQTRSHNISPITKSTLFWLLRRIQGLQIKVRPARIWYTLHYGYTRLETNKKTAIVQTKSNRK